MQTVRMRIIGSQADTQSMISLLQGMEGIDRIEEVDGLLPHMDDDDSSSLGLPDDMGPGAHALEVDVGNEDQAERVRQVAGELAERFDANVEFVDEF